MSDVSSVGIMKADKKVSILNTSTMRYYALLAGLYVILIFTLPPNTGALQAYNLQPLEYRIILLALALPSLAVWLTAFVGYTKLHQYARAIRGTPEASTFERLATGCSWLAWSLPLGVLLPMVLNSFANRWPGFHPTAIIISNYLNLIFALIAFSFIAQASRTLLASKDPTDRHSGNAHLIIILFLVIGVMYCFLTFRQFDLSSLAASHNPYFLPIWLMVLTITVPSLYAWFIGLLASYEILLYSRLTQGLLYRKALIMMSAGLLAVVISYIATQYLNSVIPRIGYLVIDYRLTLILFFRILGGIGFVLLAFGAVRLKRIEEV